MKYQTFNSSCCYAGLANILDSFSFDVEDRDIAIGAELPYMLRFYSSQNSFLAGPMLQGSEWFDLYLRPRGLRFVERSFSAENAVKFLADSDTRIMLGVDTGNGERQALVLDGLRGGRFHFISNKWKDSDGSERYMLTPAELYDRLPEEDNVLGWVEQSTRVSVDFLEKMYVTLENIQIYRSGLREFCSVPRDRLALQWAMQPLFRALFSDILCMMEMVGETRIVLMIRVLQKSLAAALNSEREVFVPFDIISEQQLNETLDRYAEIVHTRMTVISK